MKLFDTIAAISTPPGVGGIAIIRVSGSEAEQTAQKILRTKSGKPLTELDSHKLTLCTVLGADGQALDEALTAVMRAPHSYTGETVVEINCHGGYLAARLTLDALIQAGARLADAGEFTQRAFINGKTDLTRAEAVMDLIHANSRMGLQYAAHSMEGRLAKRIEQLRETVMALTAQISAAADYPDEEEGPNPTEMREKLIEIHTTVRELADSFERGRILRDGVCTVIVGRPNVGKSSILNALTREERAIVTDIPGTTRDVVEEFVQVRGIALRLLDTAGIHEGADEVERIGIARAKENMESADLCLFVLDASEPIGANDLEIAKALQNKCVFILLNKADKDCILKKAELAEQLGLPSAPVFETAVPRQGKPAGLKELEDAIAEKFLQGGLQTEDVYAFSARQKEALLRAGEAVSRVLEGMEQGMPSDILYVDLEETLTALGEITGSTVQEEIIAQVFERFCVGK
uniref:tRNA modification GTPase MnmE n=1 Tax=uncultured Bacillota bacterium TaxID=344338 RepID=A0A650ENI3_9FIRM|nr:tRNA modification GTPase MnmE [uncultured Firmicutes bacterium]